jgi:pheromone shutdown protein TraB
LIGPLDIIILRPCVPLRLEEDSCSEFSRILVEERDALLFANCCIKSLESDHRTTACIVGLVHLDGVAQWLEQ